MSSSYVRIGSLADAAAFREAVAALNLDLPCDDAPLKAPESPLAQPLRVLGRTIGNRFCIHPMEGWDCQTDGNPSELTQRRWTNFGRSGAKLIWGGEAVAICHEGRANPNQLMIAEHTLSGIEKLRNALLDAHREQCGSTDDLLIGLQLTHSGRFCRPNRKDRLEPRIAYHHPILDRKFGITPDYPVLTDGEIREIIAGYHVAARRAQKLGFDFVDVKHCHGYLGHELLSSFTRPGDYGGSFENRTRYLREIVEGIRREAPGLGIGVRLSAFDLVPFRPDPTRAKPGKLGPGIPEDYQQCMPYHYAFGCNVEDPLTPNLTETIRFFALLRDLGIDCVNVTGGSPYYNPHIQRPALFPPSDGYLPPEDPLVGVARQIEATAQLKALHPKLCVVGSAYTYLQEYIALVAQYQVRHCRTDFVGLGRMVLSYPQLPAD
ncbi:MAG TPA: NADH:flavin oxidoreductase, partial [Armatimonadota bacterium]|nr:NADH:flavin oxidoreductase [Armatimonadota bacterium]